MVWLNSYARNSILKRILSKSYLKTMTYKTLPAPTSSNKQVREYTAAVEKGFKSVFVMPSPLGWQVSLARNQKVVGTYQSKNAAITEAKKQSATSNGTFFVFDRTGELVEA